MPHSSSSQFLLRSALKEERTLHRLMPRREPGGLFSVRTGAFTPWLIFFVSTLAVSLLFQRLGFGLSIGLFMLVTMRWVARQSWLSTIVMALATPIVLYLGFVRILMIPLPLAPPGL